MSNETDARIIIDDQLRQAGWNPADKSQVVTEIKTEVGKPDYVLLDQRGRSLAVIEAKKNAIDPYTAKQQALPYAQNLRASFIFLTNGELIYFWDYLNDDARLVNSFFSRRDLERLVEMRSNRKPLATIAIPDYYLQQGETREVRPYQQEAMRAMDHALELGKRRFLIELPTGTGKTDLICLQIKRLIDAGIAEKILFLVDREQLAKQARESITDILLQYDSYWLKPGIVRQEKQITIALLQTMIGRYPEFTSGYFDIVIADECHRSIYGAWQTALTYFDAFHLGLTATPAGYIDRNTFNFYQCRNEQPDFSYPIQDAFKSEYLVPYTFAKGITEILADGAEKDGVEYDPAAFERKWTNEDTNRLMMEEFDRLAWENYLELAPGQKIGPGKSIVFAITKSHAARLTRYLNELHPECKGKYAEVITSDVANADDLIRRFKYEDYPQVAVSVDMLSTGFDCREVLHLVMCCRIRSPILYQQIRGRGTRVAPHIGKQRFMIYDFFRNHKYFNDSDEDFFAGTGTGRSSGGSGGGPHPPRELIELGIGDHWKEAVQYVEIGNDGEQLDKRRYVSIWEETINNQVADDPILQKIRAGAFLTEEEETQLEQQLNQPRYYFNEENLRRAYNNQQSNLIDFIKAALKLVKIKSLAEQKEEIFRAWLIAKSFTPEQAQYLSLLKNRGIAKGQLNLEDLFQPPLSVLNAAGLGIELFGEQGLRDLFEDLNRSVFLNDRTGTDG
ncbi:DEAD/DEAH box helicase family protein [Synechocystis sp. LEGE 06083]|uniref:type I restriction endonuclease subunit R n=1 Tax=Synechocystis sp. LEGE 06083 TaxID=915336 RepID=UPI001881831D|nr:type I restriction endonuclease subunit R [Synechocystis sp. LEGE 06083]MBE9194781.1 DEAD/DEAH box helicase family protein [Synechocystis sp. LEGE 06083]